MTLADLAKTLDVVARIATITANYLNDLDAELEK